LNEGWAGSMEEIRVGSRRKTLTEHFLEGLNLALLLLD
jgi:hypothetical protein